MKKSQANALLLLVTVIWGGGFIFVESLLNSGVPAGMLTMVRGIIFIICTFALFRKEIFRMKRADVKVGLIAGVTNAVAFLLQTIGQKYTTASHSALITVTYVIFTALACWIFYGARPNLKTAFAAIMCVLGTFLLVGGFGKGSLNLLGDGLVLLCAVIFGINIAYLGKSGKQTHYGVVSFFMAVTLFGVSLVYTLAAREFYLPAGLSIPKTVLGFAYLGILSSTLCQVLQVSCQRYTSPSTASVILTLEGFFGGVFALLTGEPLTWRLAVGGIIIVLALILQEAEIPAFEKNLRKSE